jgi:hypothetical protein
VFFTAHVLPKGFVKVRYFGFFGSVRRQGLAVLRKRLEEADPDKNESTKEEQTTDQAPTRTLLCPSCGKVLRLERTIQLKYSDRPGRLPPFARLFFLIFLPLALDAMLLHIAFGWACLKPR